MKKILLAIALLASACGYGSRDNEIIGQAKKVRNETPIICPDYKTVDISLGVIRNGVGSMSTQDIWLTVEDPENFRKLREAVEKGSIVKVTYDVARFRFCVDEHLVRSVEVVQ